MSVYWIIIYLAAGLILLIKSADYFVDAAVKIAEISGIPKLIIGATIVSLATTLPELLVSTQSVIAGSNQMAVGNAIGSVIFNTAVILSIAAIYMAGTVDRKNVTEKSLILLFSLVTLVIFGWDMKIRLWEAVVQLLIVVLYICLNLKAVKTQKEKPRDIGLNHKTKILMTKIIILIISAVGIYFGSQFLVASAREIALRAGLSQDVIGLTILAIGTSLPELSTTITSVIKKQQSLSVGNILGANILDTTLIMGVAGVIGASKGTPVRIVPRPLWPVGTVPQTLYIDIPVALLVILIFSIPMIKHGYLRKWQGFLGIGLYIVYISYLLINVGA